MPPLIQSETHLENKLSRTYSQSIHVPFNDECPPDLLCTEAEVMKMLQSLDTTKSSGPDGISAQMLKSTAHSITPSVTQLFNLSITAGIFPDKWKHSYIVPIPKSNDHTSPTNYRPISLLSILSKLLERHIYGIITEHLESHRPLAASQWGFQAGKSTTTALLSTTHNILNLLEAGNEVCTMFFDFRKAFDSVPHRKLIDKMQDLGLNEHILLWVKSYLTDRSQKVIVNGKASDPTPVLSGVPQGSVIGPLLFLIYIDGVMNLPLSEKSNLILYADDILLYRAIKCESDYSVLQDDINTINYWVEENHMQFNTAKCKYMLISHKRHKTTSPTALTIASHQIDKVESFKYLGLLFTSDLSWSKHITSVCNKARRLLGLLYRRFYQQSEPETLLKLYMSLVRPHLEYASQVWSPHINKDITLLENVQKFAFKLCTKQWDLVYEQLLVLLDLPRLSTRRLYLDLLTMYKIIHGLVYYPPNIFTARIGRTTNTARPYLYHCPFAHTNYYKHSFIVNNTTYHQHMEHLTPHSSRHFILII